MAEAPPAPAPEPAVAFAEVARLVVARVVGPGEAVVRDAADAEEVPTLAPGLHLSAWLARDDRVEALTGLAGYGGWPRVRPHALDNLRRLPVPVHHARPLDDKVEESPLLHVFTAEDVFGASRLLVLDDLLAASRVGPAPHGTLVALPQAHLLAVHVLTGPDVDETLTALASLGRAGARATWPVSPEVYFRGPQGHLQRVTRTLPDGEVLYHLDGPFAEKLTELGRVGL